MVSGAKTDHARSAFVGASSYAAAGGARQWKQSRLLSFAAALLTLWALIGSCLPASFRKLEDLPGNFHVVDAGRLYRSAQPSAQELETAVETLKIRGVLNLRGANPGTPWYDEERRVCNELGVALIDVPMNASTMPTPELADQILTQLQNLPYPVLVHCTGGSDRTGAVAALYRMSVLSDDKAPSLGELSSKYLHFKSLMPCMDRFAELFDPGPDWPRRYALLASRPCED